MNKIKLKGKKERKKERRRNGRRERTGDTEREKEMKETPLSTNYSMFKRANTEYINTYFQYTLVAQHSHGPV